MSYTLAALYPGIVTDPPGYAFFQTGAAGTVDLFLQSVTGAPVQLFSVFSGDQAPLNLISGNNNDFYFGQGRMKWGNGTIGGVSGSGCAQIFWNGEYTSATEFGLGIFQTDFSANNGSPQIVKRTNANLKYTEVSNFVGARVEFKSNLGGYSSATLPGIYDYTAANTYSNYDYGTPQTNSATTPSNFMGFGWGCWDGASTLYNLLTAQRDSVEIGYFQNYSNRYDIGGKGALVLRNSQLNPTSPHPSGVTFFASGDSSLNIRTSSGANIQLAPGITGVNRYAHSSGIYKTLDYGVNSYVSIGSEYDGKIAYNTKATSHQIFFNHEQCLDGFSCQIIHETEASCAFSSTDDGVLFLNNMPVQGPGLGGRTFVSVKGSTLYVNSTEPALPIHLPVGQIYTTVTSGAGTGLITTPTNKTDYKTLDFDQANVEYAQAEMVMPLGWTSFKCRFEWTAASGAGNVQWGARALGMGDIYNLDNNWGTEQTIIDSKALTSGIHKTDFTSGITPSSIDEYLYSPVKLQIYRKASNVLDTLTADARLLGVTLIKA